MRIHYAAVNNYSTPYEIGFSNTWNALAFRDKKSRDDFVRNDPNWATRAITKNEVTRYACSGIYRPRPFTAEYWGIDPDPFIDPRPKGYLGYVAIINGYDYPNNLRVYK